MSGTHNGESPLTAKVRRFPTGALLFCRRPTRGRGGRSTFGSWFVIVTGLQSFFTSFFSSWPFTSPSLSFQMYTLSCTAAAMWCIVLRTTAQHPGTLPMSVRLLPCICGPSSHDWCAPSACFPRTHAHSRGVLAPSVAFLLSRVQVLWRGGLWYSPPHFRGPVHAAHPTVPSTISAARTRLEFKQLFPFRVLLIIAPDLRAAKCFCQRWRDAEAEQALASGFSSCLAPRSCWWSAWWRRRCCCCPRLASPGPRGWGSMPDS